MKLDPDQVRKLAKFTFGAKPAHVSCEDWSHMVAEFVEGARAGEDLSSERMRIVWQHAKDCPPCMEELEVLQRICGEEAEDGKEASD